MDGRVSTRSGLTAVLVAVCLGGATLALDPKQPESSLALREFFLPELYVSTAHAPVEELLGRLPNGEAWSEFLAARGESGAVVHAFVDPRSGAATNLIGAFPLIPGRGVGNRITLDELGDRLGRRVVAVDAATVAAAARGFVAGHAKLLGIDPEQLGELTAVRVNPDLWQVSAPQLVDGIPVRDARFALSISHGNVVVAGTEIWGDVRLDTTPRVGSDVALDNGFAYAGAGAATDVVVRGARLEIVPVAPPEYQAGEAYAGPIGAGYRHRLVWTFVFQVPTENASWEAMVDAHSGEVIAFQDLNRYVDRQISGGVYPVTSTEICPNAGQCGDMRSGWPMPWANTGLPSPNNFTDGAGIYDDSSGAATTTLSGRYVRMVDSCGSISVSGSGDVDLGGTNGQHDCSSGGGSAGNTPASRACSAIRLSS